MTRRPFLAFSVAALLFLVALNLLLALWGHRQVYVLKLEKMRAAHSPNLIFLGNSLLDGHLDERAFATAAAPARFTPLNAALGATDPPEHLLLFDYAQRLHPSLRTLVIGFYDFQLTAPDRTQPRDLVGNRMVGLDHRFSLSEVSATYHFDAKGRMELALLRALPMAADRSNAWKNVELLRRKLAAMGMPAVATNSMGRVDDFATLEAGSTTRFDAQARTFLNHQGDWNASYQKIFQQARAAGIRIVLVAMPASPSHRQTYYSRPLWGQYLSTIEDQAQRQQITVLDASNWLPEAADFVDHLHMSPAGVEQFSTRLGRTLASPPAERTDPLDK